MVNNSTTKESILRELRMIPWVGKAVAQDLYELWIRKIADLIDKNPDQLYEEHCRQKWQIVDRCMLYTFKCAVYFASNKTHDPELLKWWHWKN